jgi:cob(I)alamin adenosyltransferase
MTIGEADDSMRGKSRVLIFTGDGKGKTTAALGMALRASGHGFRILIIQFIKANASTGELTAFKHLPGVEMIQMGRGFTPPADDPAFSEHRKAAQDALQMALKALQSRRYDLIILDEICTAVTKGLLAEDQVVEFIDQGEENSCLVLTGRGATDQLISKADTVTEMCCFKHGLHEGWTARKGVEY